MVRQGVDVLSGGSDFLEVRATPREADELRATGQVVKFAGYLAVDPDQFLDRGVVRVGGDRGEVGVALRHGVGAEVGGRDVEARARVAAEV